jgi:hypothetical protein
LDVRSPSSPWPPSPGAQFKSFPRPAVTPAFQSKPNGEKRSLFDDSGDGSKL